MRKLGDFTVGHFGGDGGGTLGEGTGTDYWEGRHLDTFFDYDWMMRHLEMMDERTLMEGEGLGMYGMECVGTQHIMEEMDEGDHSNPRLALGCDI